MFITRCRSISFVAITIALIYTYQHHQVFNIAYYVHYSLSKYQFHRDNNCIAWFVEELKNLANNVKTILSANIFMAFTRNDCRIKFSSIYALKEAVRKR